MDRRERTRWGAPVVLAGLTAVLAVSFLPWARSGSAPRNSYELVRAAERLEVLEPPFETLAQAWFLLPLVVALAWLAVLVGRPVAAALLAIVAAAATGALVLAAQASPLGADVGMAAASASGLIALFGAGRILWEQRGRS